MKENLSALRHWALQRDGEGIAWLTLDKHEAQANVLSLEVMTELASALDELDRQPPTGLVIRSGKEAGFIAGADIDEFSELNTPVKGRELIARGWNLFNRLAEARYPTLALIRGHCLGGGLELALACRHRIVVDEASTKLGLPEVMLGIFPGWGGMQRLPQLIGPAVALDLMLTGKTVNAKKAKTIGLADACIAPRVMDAAARGLLLSGRAPHRPAAMQRLMNTLPGRAFIGGQARKQVARKARPEHYPAPYAIIDLWQKHQGNALLAPEIIDRIVSSPTARNLLRVFRLQERLKSFGKADDADVKRVHVVGAGVMGGDIAAWCALRGLSVTLQDQSLERITPALARAATLVSRRVKNALDVRAVLDRLMPDVAGDGVRHADVIIEAIFEDLEAKRSLLQSLESKMKPSAVVATNTSSLRIEDLRSALQQPARLVGIHFFNPVPLMPLVEVVETDGVDKEAVRKACAFVRQIDKLPLPVRSAPGFLVNAVLAPYMLAAMRAVDEGIAPQTVDSAMRAFGMPMGPIELADTVGLDIALAAGKQLADAGEPPRCLADCIARGALGKKSGRGFYEWSAGQAKRERAESIPAGLAEKLLAPLIDKAAHLVEQRVVADADLADAGVIFGTGFAPFTGGPLQYRLAKLK